MRLGQNPVLFCASGISQISRLVLQNPKVGCISFGMSPVRPNFNGAFFNKLGRHRPPPPVAKKVVDGRERSHPPTRERAMPRDMSKIGNGKKQDMNFDSLWISNVDVQTS